MKELENPIKTHSHSLKNYKMIGPTFPIPLEITFRRLSHHNL